MEKLFDLTEVAEDVRRGSRFWFYGYNLNSFSDHKVYNSFAIAEFLANERVSNYWEKEYALLYVRDMRLFRFEPLRRFYTRLMREGAAEMPLSDLHISTTDRIHLADLLAAEVPDFEVGDVARPGI